MSGVIAALGLAPFAMWPVALAGFAVIFTLTQAAATRRAAALTGWFAGLGYFAFALVWIVEPFFIEPWKHGWMAPFALLFMSGGLALFWAAASAAAFKRGALGWVAALALAELARAYVFTGFPWALIGYIWSETPLAIYASFIGSHGLTLFTLALAAALGAGLKGARLGPALALLALLVGFFFERGYAFNYAHILHGPTVRLIQPNAAQHEKWDPELIPTFWERQLEYTQAAGAHGKPDLIVWPETAIPWTLGRADGALEQIAEAANGTPVVLGLQRFDGPKLYNSLLMLDGQSTRRALYDKYHLVPFGEYMPLGNFLARFGIHGLAAQHGNGYSAGPGPQLMNIEGLGTALPLICYEAVFPQDVSAAPTRPDYLLQITNDAWFGQFSGPHQHLSQARMRAIEQGLPMIRAANTGVSAMIGPHGRVLASLPLGTAGYLDAPLLPPLPPTLYSRTGDWLALALMLALLASSSLFYRLRN
nr:apolipoprotein N-acyltransferase [Lentibacter algarum]